MFIQYYVTPTKFFYIFVKNKNLIDKIFGAIVILLFGDMIGLQCKYPNKKYTNIPGSVYYCKYKTGEKVKGGPGQGSHIAELLHLIMDHICENTEYNITNMLKKYLEWGATNNVLSGHNMLTLFSAKTIKGYAKHKNNIINVNYISPNQSNDCLFRAIVVTLFSKSEVWRFNVGLDCELTNSDPICKDCVIVFNQALRILLSGGSIQDALNAAHKESYNSTVKQYITHAINKYYIEKIYYKSKWILHTVYISFYVLNLNLNFEQSLEHVLKFKGDYSGNLAAFGALFGAYHGYEKLIQDYLVNIHYSTYANFDPTMSNRPSSNVPIDHIFEKILHLYQCLFDPTNII